MIEKLWYVTWHVTVLVVGWSIASAHHGEEGVWVGMAVAIAGGPAFAWFSGVARKLAVERYSVRVEVHEFRFTWIWMTIWFGGSSIAGWAVADQLFVSYRVEESILLMGIAGMLVGGWFARMAGRHGACLRVDLAAGVVEYVGGDKPIAVPIASFKPFVVEKYRKPYRMRHNPDWFRLRTDSLPNVVIADSVYPGGVNRLQAKLQARIDELRDVAAVRRILAETPGVGSDFRAGPDVRDAIRAAVADPAQALLALRSDPDAEIRARAHALAAP